MNLTDIMLCQRSQAQKSYTIYDSIYIKFKNRFEINLCLRSLNNGSPLAWGLGVGLTGSRHEGVSEELVMCYF